jgi:oligopeptide transport system substrate-binding protein
MKKISENKFIKVLILLSLFAFIFSLPACDSKNSQSSDSFYAQNEPPKKQEFRWSNGKMPKSFDPADASLPPEADIIRAIYEGLTDLDAITLEPKSAVAESWESTENDKVWIFKLRQNAKWSNGEIVTAKDFEKSWKRLILLNEKVSQNQLLKNIQGVYDLPKNAESEEIISVKPTNSNKVEAKNKKQTESNTNQTETKSEKIDIEKIGIVAIDDWTLRVSLKEQDKDFPKLIAHPIFRPVYDEGKSLEGNDLRADVVTNGAFRISSVGNDGVTLDRSETYWNKENIGLQRVKFVPTENPEVALAAYKSGELDAITNLHFEPLALKLLTPYQDFKRITHNALNYYEFNRKHPPFDDVRVREALAIAIDRERLSADEMDGSTLPAFTFLPLTQEIEFTHNVEKAKLLLSEKGFPNGKNFPKVKLLISKNDIQKRIANAVADMWKKNLNIDTEIIIESRADFDKAEAEDNYDVIRRGVVLPTTSETVNMMAIFSTLNKEISKPKTKNENLSNANANLEVAGTHAEANSNENSETNSQISNEEEKQLAEKPILTEEEAVKEIPAIPLYYPTSYSLVKPYVKGFENNVLDAPSLKKVEIDQNWQTEKDAKK